MRCSSQCTEENVSSRRDPYSLNSYCTICEPSKRTFCLLFYIVYKIGAKYIKITDEVLIAEILYLKRELYSKYITARIDLDLAISSLKRY